MNKQGVVIARDGDLATVEIYNNPNCLTCEKRSKTNSCNTCADYDDNASYRVVAINDEDAEIGDLVTVKVSKRQKLILSLISFVIPVVFAVVSYLILSLFTEDEQIRSKVAIFAGIVAVIIAGLYSYKVSKNTCEHRIISITKENEE